MEDEKIFDAWNAQKKTIHKNNSVVSIFPQKRDVWICAFGKNLGFEQNGTSANFSRPALVIKKFNNQMFWVVPLSTKQKDLDFYYNFRDPYSQNVSIILAQIRLVSIKRFGRKLYELPSSDFETVVVKLRDFLS